MDMVKIIDKIAQRSSIEASEGDYIEDGLLMCGKCHTRKQARLEIMGQVRTPFCLCKCQAEKRDADEAARKKEEQMIEIDRMRSVGFPDKDMRSWNFSKDDHADEKLSLIAHKYVENFDEMRKRGKGLLFFGSVGTGKTFMSACIANALIERGHPCLVTNFARLVNTISGMYDGKQEYLDSLNDYTLMIIDDLASERDTEYMNEIVMNIIDSRYRSGNPLIVTTNLTSDELKNPAEIRKQRIYSRLFEMCVPIEVKGRDRRKEKLKSDYDELAEILGIKEGEK